MNENNCKRDIVTDVKTLEDFVGYDSPTHFTAKEFQALTNLQLEMYKELLNLKK